MKKPSSRCVIVLMVSVILILQMVTATTMSSIADSDANQRAAHEPSPSASSEKVSKITDVSSERYVEQVEDDDYILEWTTISSDEAGLKDRTNTAVEVVESHVGPYVDPVPSFWGESYSSDSPTAAYMPPSPSPGQESLIVLLVRFTDMSNTRTSSNVTIQVFTTMDGYYREVSYGQAWLSGGTAGWFTLAHDMAYYGEDWSGTIDDPDHDGYSESWWLIQDAVQAADSTVDFSLYGHVMVLHAGNGQESTGTANDIWSVRWHGLSIATNDGVTITYGSIVPELEFGLASTTLGVMAHEFGHDIGLPDLYHYGHEGEDDFVYDWCLMASGSWNGVPAGSSPAHPVAFCKMAAGWLTTGIVEFGPDSHGGGYFFAQETISTYDQVIKITVSPTQYYLVEVRSDYGYDAALPYPGVLISYCDETSGSGQGIVRLQDAHPGTLTLSDAAYLSGESFISSQLHIDIDYVSSSGEFASITVMWKDENWIADQVVASEGQGEQNPDIASDSEGNLYAVYENLNPPSGLYRVAVSKSTDGGAIWNDLFSIGSSTRSWTNPSLVVDVGWYDTIFIVCEERVTVSNHNIVGFAYNDSGGQFLYIDTDEDNDRYPCIASEFEYGSSNYLYVGYESIVTSDDRDVVVKRSTDHGYSWAQVHRRGWPIDMSVYCDLSIASTVGSDSQHYVYVAYAYGSDYSTTYSVAVDVSTDSGASWAQRWAYSGTSQEKHATSISSGHSTGTVVVGWCLTWSLVDKDVQLAYSTDNGVNWATLWLAGSTLNETSIDIGVDGQGEDLSSVPCPYFHAVYHLGDNVMYARAAANRPNVWTAPEVVNSEGSASTVYLMPAVTGVNRQWGTRYPAIVWTDIGYGYDICYSTRGGTATFTTQPAGLSVFVAGTEYSTPVAFEWVAGVYRSFSVRLIEPGVLGVRYAWSNWTGGWFADPYQQSISWICDPYDINIVACFQTEYSLTVESAHATSSGEGWYASGSTAYAGVDADIVAGVTGERFVFHSWSGDASGTDYAQCSAITMDGPKGATAIWQTEYYLTVTTAHDAPSGEGWYASGTTAYASLSFGIVSGENGERFVFEAWSEDASGSDYDWSDPITVDGPKTAVAVWQTEYYLTVTTAHATPGGEGWYASGSAVYAVLDVGVVPGDTGVRYVFLNWAGDGSGSNYASSDAIVMDGPMAVLVSWQTEYYLVVTTAHATPSGEAWYASGTTAYACLSIGIVSGGTGERFVFEAWSGDSSGSDYAWSDPITMDGPKTATAVWQTEYYLTVVTAHATPSGEGWYASGTSAHAGVDADIVSGVTGERFVFQSWDGDVSGTDYSQSDSITMDGPKTATAAWQTEYYLTVASSHATPSGEGWYASGTTVYAGLDAGVLPVTTGERLVFHGWSDDATGIDHTQSDPISMDGPKTATAAWQTEYYLTVSSAHGTPSGEGWYVNGTTAYASVDADMFPGVTGERFVFQSWSDDAAGTNRTQSDGIDMDGPRTATAVWQTEYRLICTTNPLGLSPVPTIEPSGEWFSNGTSVTMVAQDVSGYEFSHWTVDSSSRGAGVASIVVAMSVPHTAVAYYDEISTTTTTTTPTPGDMMGGLLVIGGVGSVVAIVVVAVIAKKRKS